jgi:hypothetical protein
MSAPEQEGRAYDERGNVRPADPRFLPAQEEPKPAKKAATKKAAESKESKS